MKLFSLFLLLFFSASQMVGCTGINLTSWALGHSSHPNPTPEYLGPGGLLRGGLVLHRNSIPGGVGVSGEGKLYKGEACSYSILWLYSGGDSSISQARQNARIRRIHYVEYRQEATMGFFYHNFCTIVVGSRDE
jgi:hypothetical protein